MSLPTWLDITCSYCQISKSKAELFNSDQLLALTLPVVAVTDRIQELLVCLTIWILVL